MTLCPDRVIKQQEPERARLEWRRTLAGREVGRATGLFRVPRIESYDEATGTLVLDRIHGIVPLSLVVWEHPAPEALASRAARALVAIHSQLELPEDAPGPPASSTDQSEWRAVPIHGDFGLTNLFLSVEDDELVIIDWCTARWMPQNLVRAPASVDLVSFLVSVFYRRYLNPFALRFVRGVEAIGRSFLETYAREAPKGICTDELRSMTSVLVPVFAARRRAYDGALRALACRPSLWHLSKFVGSVSFDTGSKEH